MLNEVLIDNIAIKFLAANESWVKRQELHLQGNPHIEDQGVIWLSYNRSWKLSKLTVNNSNFGDVRLEMLRRNKVYKDFVGKTCDSQAMRKELSIGSNQTWIDLQEFCLNENRVENPGAITIGSNITWDRLKKLYLDSNNIGDEGAVAIGTNTTWIDLEQLLLQQNQRIKERLQ